MGLCLDFTVANIGGLRVRMSFCVIRPCPDKRWGDWEEPRCVWG